MTTEIFPVSESQPFDVGKMLSLADMAQQMRARQTQMQNQNALSHVLANPQSYDPNGDINQNALRAVTAANPQIGMQMKEDTIQEKLRRAQAQHYQTESGKQTFDFMSGIAGVAYDAYTESKKTGASEQDAIASATKARNSAVDASGGMLSDQQGSGIKSSVWEPVQGKAFASMNRDWVAGSRAQSVAEIGIRKEDTAERRLAETERQDRTRDMIMVEALKNKESTVNPKTQAYEAFMKSNPNATPQQQAQFIQTTGQAPRSTMAMATAKFSQDHPDATAEDFAKFYSGMRAEAASTTAWDSPSGKGGAQIQALNTATNHLETLRKLGDALKNKDTQAFNQIANEWATQTGNPAPTNWDSAMQIIGGETVKAVVPGGGGVSERAHAQLNKKLGPEQIGGAVDTIEELMRGQATSARTQYVQTTKRDEEEFYKRFDPPAQKVLFGRGEGKADKVGKPTSPKVGTVDDGHRFKGGDPSKPESWEKI